MTFAILSPVKNMLVEQRIRQHLDNAITLCFFDELTSTNDCPVAHAYPYALVVTKQQTAGRGQRHKSWQSDAQASLTFSFYHQKQTTYASPLWQIVVANVLAGALKGLSLKWPNDLIYEGGKCGGILIESEVRGDNMQVISGIGLNIQPIYAEHDTYVVTHYPLSTCPNRFIADVANQLVNLARSFDEETQISQFNQKHVFHQQRVSVMSRMSNQSFIGVVVGIDEHALLAVQCDNNDIIHLNQDYKVRPI